MAMHCIFIIYQANAFLSIIVSCYINLFLLGEPNVVEKNFDIKFCHKI